MYPVLVADSCPGLPTPSGELYSCASHLLYQLDDSVSSSNPPTLRTSALDIPILAGVIILSNLSHLACLQLLTGSVGQIEPDLVAASITRPRVLPQHLYPVVT